MDTNENELVNGYTEKLLESIVTESINKSIEPSIEIERQSNGDGVSILDEQSKEKPQEEDDDAEGEEEEADNNSPPSSSEQSVRLSVNGNGEINTKSNENSKMDDDSGEPTEIVSSVRTSIPLPADPIARANLTRPEGAKLKDLLKKAVKSAGDYNRQINLERREERRFSLDLQTYTFHYPVGLGLENRTLQHNVQNGRYRQIGKYPVAMLPGHFQDWYRNYSPQELKYLPINTVLYGPVIGDPDMLPPLLSRFEEDSYSDSDVESQLSSDHSCCCDESRCKKLKVDSAEGDDKCDCLLSGHVSSSDADDSDEADSSDDDNPPPLPILVKAYDSNGVCCWFVI